MNISENTIIKIAWFNLFYNLYIGYQYFRLSTNFITTGRLVLFMVVLPVYLIWLVKHIKTVNKKYVKYTYWFYVVITALWVLEVIYGLFSEVSDNKLSINGMPAVLVTGIISYFFITYLRKHITYTR